ncbi:MAG TPA: hypothetical protein VGB94_00030 [Acidobacteriaceae bacterium]
MHTNDHEPKQVVDPENPGYETTDINVGGIIVFLAGLSGFVLIFFVFCFGMGKVINRALQKQDGPTDRWHQQAQAGKLENLASNPKLEQQQLQSLTTQFPQPRLQSDDGNQDVADLHTREDLLLDHYSYVNGGKPGAIRIPIDRAMELIAQRGLPTAPQVAPAAALTGAKAPIVEPPLTNGFARTGFELDEIQSREEKMQYEPKP